MPSGWFPDPLDRYDHRYFNGTNWTSDVSSDGVRHVDPLGARPGPGTSGGSSHAGNRAATAAVVMGSIALVIAWIPFIVVVGATLAVLAVVFGIRGLRRSKQTGTGRGASLAGLIMGGLGMGASVVGVVLSVVFWNAVVEFVEPGDHDVEVTSCEIDGRAMRVAGTIENQSDVAREYTVFVEVDGRTETAIVEAVAQGATADWSVTITAPSVPDTCDPELIVHGPLPFDLELDPINR